MRKYICALLALILVLALPMAASAEQTDQKWVLSEDGETLTYGDKVYNWYPLPPGELLLSDERYVYEGYLPPLFGEYELKVVTVPGNENMVFLLEYSSAASPQRVYVTAEGAAILDAYREGRFSSWYLQDIQEYDKPIAPLEEALTAKLDTPEDEPLRCEAERLLDMPRYEILGLDETHSLAHIHGAVYRLPDGYYYLNYDLLDNTHFTVTGEFSYRSGDVELYPLSSASADLIEDAIASAEDWDTTYIYQEDETDTIMEPDTAAGIFWVLSVIFGFVIPAVPLVLGLVFAQSKKACHPKRWYWLSALAALWMALAAAIIIVITTA